MDLIRIVDWNKYQHYKNRNPPWIKLHRELLTSPTWVSCDDASRVLAVALMLLAAQTDNKIPADPAYLQRVAYLNTPPVLKFLIKVQFIEYIGSASNLLADASVLQATCVSTEEETEQSREKPPIVPLTGDELVYTPEFQAFWTSYPRHTGKGDAFKSWKKLKPSQSLQAKIQTAIEAQRKSEDWLKDSGKYIPNPATWLNQRRFDDDILRPEPVKKVWKMSEYL